MSEFAALRCAGVQRFVDTYLDGEFGDAERAEFEAHLQGCEPCRKKVRVQADWKQAVKTAAPRELAPAALRNRVLRQIHHEAATVGQSPLRRLARRAMPVGAAAAMLAMFLVSKVSWSPVAADVIAKHQRNLPIEVTGGSDQVRRWYMDKVDFPVHVPNFAGLGGASVALRGGRLANIRDRQAACLFYDVHGNKMSVFIFDPGELPMEAKRKEVIGNREVYLDGERGYNVALYRDQGVGYAIASDLDQDELVKLVSSAVKR
jgi:mycothiol system anti-sigma-R factor